MGVCCSEAVAGNQLHTIGAAQYTCSSNLASCTLHISGFCIEVHVYRVNLVHISIGKIESSRLDSLIA